MTPKPNAPEFSIYIRGITYEDAVTLCESQFLESIDNWYATDDDDDCNVDGGGVISIPIRHMDDLMEILCDIRAAEGWTDASGWQIELHATRLMPTYNLGATVTDTGCNIHLMPCRPANKAVDEALSRMQLAIADARAAACLLEEPAP